MLDSTVNFKQEITRKQQADIAEAFCQSVANALKMSTSTLTDEPTCSIAEDDQKLNAFLSATLKANLTPNEKKTVSNIWCEIVAKYAIVNQDSVQCETNKDAPAQRRKLLAESSDSYTVGSTYAIAPSSDDMFSQNKEIAAEEFKNHPFMSRFRAKDEPINPKITTGVDAQSYKMSAALNVEEDADELRQWLSSDESKRLIKYSFISSDEVTKANGGERLDAAKIKLKPRMTLVKVANEDARLEKESESKETAVETGENWAMIGGIIGGVVFVLCAIAIAVAVMRKKSNKTAMKYEEDDKFDHVHHYEDKFGRAPQGQQDKMVNIKKSPPKVKGYRGSVKLSPLHLPHVSLPHSFFEKKKLVKPDDKKDEDEIPATPQDFMKLYGDRKSVV